MKLSVMLNYSGDVMAAADEAIELEHAGLDCVWVAEAYSFDAVSMMGYLAGRSNRLEIGSAIVNIYSRTPTLLAMTAAGLDVVSGGRINLGLGGERAASDRGLPRRSLRKAIRPHQGSHRRVSARVGGAR